MTTFVTAEASLISYQLDAPVGGSGVGHVNLIVVDLVDSDGVSGMGFSYVLGASATIVLHAAREQLARFLAARQILPPQALWRQIHMSFNRTGLGPNVLALAAIDVAAWDHAARRQRLPLAAAMGGVAHPVAVYGSGGFTASQSPGEAARNAAVLAERGFRAVKPRVSGQPSSAALIAEVRRTVGDELGVMIDANEKCDALSARRLISLAHEHGVLFVEEPLPAAALEGYRSLAAHSPVVIATGEHLQGRSSFLPFIRDGMAGVIQPDLAMIGGLTPALELCVLAESFGVAVAPHFLPGLFVHLAAVSPAVTWLEDFPLLEPLFEGWPVISDGCMTPTDRIGHGLAVKRTR